VEREHDFEDPARVGRPLLEAEAVRREERLHVTKDERETGAVRVRKRVETDHVEDRIPRWVEEAEVERRGPNEEDSGEIETLPDGSLSIPVLEEELVVTKRVVVRERLIVRKRARTEETRVEAELGRERVEVEAEE
jgi:uncharacterized protein (TIGR02271 family)